jgi:hypothetical protein
MKKNLGRVPVGFFPGQKRAALEDENPSSRSGKLVGDRSTACAGADDDDVVVV